MWIVWDPCGMICAGLAYFFIFWAGYQVNWYMSPTENALDLILFILFNGMLAMAIWCHVAAATTDPGTVPVFPPGTPYDTIDKQRPELRDGEWVTTCKRCPTYRPLRAHHCSTCGRCVRLMDHHCPWVNNCVGEDNQKFFILFTVYIFFSALMALVLTVTRGLESMNCKEPACDRTANTLVFIFLLIESIVFALFTAIIFCDQMCSVMNDKTLLERKINTGNDNERVSSMQNLRRVFGRGLSIHWLIPVHRGVRQTLHRGSLAV